MATAPPPTAHNPSAWRALELVFWPLLTLGNVAANSVVALTDLRRVDLGLDAWKPAVWEASSGLVVLALIPALVWFTRRFPLHLDTWRRVLPWHLFGSVAFSLVHVAGMVVLREAVYASQGEDYDFGPWLQGWRYEYLKDVRAYALIVSVIETYRFVRRRLQGEARLLDEPDVGPAVEPVDRPERFLVRKLGRDFLVAAVDIEWLQASANYVNLRVRGRDYPLRSTLAALESRLDPQRFIRIHRSYAVNLDQVASIEPLDAGEARVHLKDGTVLPCSRRHREGLRARLGSP